MGTVLLYGLGVIVILMVVAAVATAIDFDKKEKRITALLKDGVEGFRAQQMYARNDRGIGLDEKRQKVCLLSFKNEKLVRQLVRYQDILSCELFEDGATLTKTVRSSQVGGALIGGLALGGVGAIIGGLSGKKESEQLTQSIQLRLIVNDTKDPVFDMEFQGFSAKKTNYLHQTCIEKARHWHGLMQVVIERADAAETSRANAARLPPAGGVADELRKLAELRGSGVLSEEEYQSLKKKMLA